MNRGCPMPPARRQPEGLLRYAAAAQVDRAAERYVLVPVIVVALSIRQPAQYEVSSASAADPSILRRAPYQYPRSERQPAICGQKCYHAGRPCASTRCTHRYAISGARRAVDSAATSPCIHGECRSKFRHFDILGNRTTPELAVNLATSYARAFTSYRHRLDAAALQRAGQDVSARISELKSSKLGDSALSSKLAETQQQLQTLQTLQTSNATVVKVPLRAPRGQPPQPLRDGALGILFGLIAGLGLAFLVDSLDTRVRSGEEVAERLGVALLGRLSEPPRKLRERNELVMLMDPFGRHAEAFRMLRTSIELANIDDDIKILAIASALPEEGKTTQLLISQLRPRAQIAALFLWSLTFESP